MGTDALVGLPWSSIHEGLRVRWVTPRFVKRGTVVERKDRALKVRFDGEDRDTAIPDARWYYTQHRMGDKENGLVVIEDDGTRHPAKDRPVSDADDDLSVADAAALFGVEPKRLRSLLRSSKVAGWQRRGQWRVSAQSLGQYLADKR